MEEVALRSESPPPSHHDLGGLQAQMDQITGEISNMTVNKDEKSTRDRKIKMTPPT